MNARILLVDDDLGFASSVKTLLKKNGMAVTVANNPSQAIKTYSQEKMDFDLLLIDYLFKGNPINGADLAETIRRQNPHQAFLFMSGLDEKDYFKNMLKVGSSLSFIEKGSGPEVLLKEVQKSLPQRAGQHSMSENSVEEELSRESEIRSAGLIGRSKILHEIVKQANNYRKFKSTFLILGASGTGKELVARLFRVPGKPFYAVDCARFAAGQEQFLESELFGHKKGAYTGADRDRKGAFEIANGGTIFFDELHTLSLTSQSKLLRTLQERNFRPLGDSSTSEVTFDATIVAAAKPEILTMMENGEFKEDLYYRLAKTEIRIPTLSERLDDVVPLAKFFVEKFSRVHSLDRALHPQALRDLEKYNWPGNVRELEGVIENLVMNSKSEIIGTEQFLAYIKSKSKEIESDKVPATGMRVAIEALESHHIIAALEKSRFIGAAADLLGIPRTTLNDKIKKLKIDPYQYLETKGV